MKRIKYDLVAGIMGRVLSRYMTEANADRLNAGLVEKRSVWRWRKSSLRRLSKPRPRKTLGQIAFLASPPDISACSSDATWQRIAAAVAREVRRRMAK